MSENAIKLKEITNSYFDQDFLLKLIKEYKETFLVDDAEENPVLDWLENKKVKEFYDKDNNLLSIEDAVFLNPAFKDIIEATTNDNEELDDENIE